LQRQNEMMQKYKHKGGSLEEEEQGERRKRKL
jgi:hypothetical protein